MGDDDPGLRVKVNQLAPEHPLSRSEQGPPMDPRTWNVLFMPLLTDEKAKPRETRMWLE